MCCFTRPVNSVSDTNIFARNSGAGRQVLVYQMRFDAKVDLAMILPLPVPPESMEGDVTFIDMKGYSDFFKDLDAGFESDMPATTDTPDRSPLKVVNVGNFIASFAPSVADMERLPPQFQLPGGTWDKLPAYKNYGFAVFKLKSGDHKVHPMAFDFPRRKEEGEKVFFPTVHIHDGKVHKTADFDHMLYLQNGPGEERRFPAWEESPKPPGSFMNAAKTQMITDARGKVYQILDPRLHVYRFAARGEFENEDFRI